ncbi:SDR family NAD(P)-dependent oxidoreductase [Aestuariivirga sp.]|uniref:SDR family NAD(P)-dependent oxidoreductase n=1 Tax=Aestuariivirga sp. TaxID=2650926 RepID=UPI0039E25E26
MSQSPFSISGRTALVTGGAKGIGRTCAEALAAAGAKVVIADMDEAAGQATAKELGGSFVKLNVTRKSEVDAVAAEITRQHGALDILVNNAGIVQNGPSEDVAMEDWQRVIDVNLNGVFYCAQAFGKEMVKAGKGSIVSISSICGSVTVYPQPQAAYNASKAAVNLLTKSLAVEWAKRGVRVNAVAPGYTATELTLAGRSKPEWFETWMRMTPMGRLGEPKEIANAVLFLASDAASYITGTVLMVDGGYTAM